MRVQRIDQRAFRTSLTNIRRFFVPTVSNPNQNTVTMALPISLSHRSLLRSPIMFLNKLRKLIVNLHNSTLNLPQRRQLG
jgi:hypothetical protein